MKEALKLALEALEKVVDGWTEAFAEYKYDSDIPPENQYRDEVFAAITAIKEALAQPAQRQPLTDEQIRQVMRSLGWTGEGPSDIEFARAIEAAHGIGEKT